MKGMYWFEFVPHSLPAVEIASFRTFRRVISVLILITLACSTLLIAEEGSQSPSWVTLGPEEAEPPLRIGSQRQLLVDNHVLCDWWEVRRVMGKVRKHPQNPILEADQAREENAARTRGIGLNGVMFDEQEGVYKLWYTILQLFAEEGQ